MDDEESYMAYYSIEALGLKVVSTAEEKIAKPNKAMKKKLKKQKQREKKRITNLCAAEQISTERNATNSYNPQEIANLQNITKNAEFKGENINIPPSNEDVAARDLTIDINSTTQGNEAVDVEDASADVKGVAASKYDLDSNEVEEKSMGKEFVEQKQDVITYYESKDDSKIPTYEELVKLQCYFRMTAIDIISAINKGHINIDTVRRIKSAVPAAPTFLIESMKDGNLKSCSKKGVKLMLENNLLKAALYLEHAWKLDMYNVSNSLNLGFCHLCLKNDLQAAYFALYARSRCKDLLSAIKATYILAKSYYNTKNYIISKVCFKSILAVMPNSACIQRELLLVEIAELKKQGYSEKESLQLLYKQTKSSDDTPKRKAKTFGKLEEISYDYDENEIYNSDTEDVQFGSNRTKSFLTNTVKLGILTNLRLRQRQAKNNGSCKKDNVLRIFTEFGEIKLIKCGPNAADILYENTSSVSKALVEGETCIINNIEIFLTERWMRIS